MRTKTKKTKQITQIVVSMLLVLTMVFMPMKMILAADAQSSSTPTHGDSSCRRRSACRSSRAPTTDWVSTWRSITATPPTAAMC